MRKTTNRVISVLFLTLLLLKIANTDSPLDLINGYEYEGSYTAYQDGVFESSCSKPLAISTEKQEDSSSSSTETPTEM